jgi:hypothetical protein
MAADPETEQRRERARQRGDYAGEIIRAGAPKPELYAELSPLERLMQMSALCRAQWLASGNTIDERPRADWPGEVFRISRG